MEQKQFLTAQDVLQMFGVDETALKDLVKSGAVKALTDQGSLKYASDDFTALRKQGFLKSAIVNESVPGDSDDQLSFFDVSPEPKSAAGSEQLSFLELDEDALNEQANPARTQQPQSLENWLGDSDGSLAEMVISDDSIDTLESSKQSSKTVLNTTQSPTKKTPESEPQQTALEDSDSDVRIVSIDIQSESHRNSNQAPQTAHDQPVLSDLLSPAGKPGSADLDSDSDVVLAFPSSEMATISDSDSDVRLSAEGLDGDDAAVNTPTGGSSSGELTFNDDSGIRLFASDHDSGISLANADSGISLASADSGISFADADSGISFADADSGISLAADDSGITLLGDDSGISLLGDDSGISLLGDDSGIRLDDGDSDITLKSDAKIPNQTIAEQTGRKVPPLKKDKLSSASGSRRKQETETHEIDLSDELLSDELMPDSAFDLDVSSEGKTIELNFDDLDEDAVIPPPPIVPKKPVPKKPQPQSLSEAFKLDEPLEVEDLDISDDLEGAINSDLSDEFAAVEEDEEVFEASDDDFSEAEVAADDEMFSDDELAAPVAKVKKGPKEPEWGMVAVAPIAISALLMLATSALLWGGIATMWTGNDAPGPVATLVSTLAGMSPF
jgi:hypothetical protein